MYKNSLIYFDNAATTPLSPTAFSAMKPWLTSEYGNPSSLYSAGRKAKEALECARAMIACTINAEPDEIFFTSGGTEANNWAIDMIGTHGDIITSNIEHHAILNAAHNRLERDVKALKLMTDRHGYIVPPNESATRSL
ncbi:aminotransferase class V-fold PLP-dependent enzyme, partial [Ruthenibacterium lactatiformans]|uniref:aminotransferase class V-fold PLP-dependent enzyme n=1 Tax=Ruthenibacterium lactatiformans TaxID=1550024 RepID=UPI0019689132